MVFLIRIIQRGMMLRLRYRWSFNLYFLYNIPDYVQLRSIQFDVRAINFKILAMSQSPLACPLRARAASSIIATRYAPVVLQQ